MLILQIYINSKKKRIRILRNETIYWPQNHNTQKCHQTKSIPSPALVEVSLPGNITFGTTFMNVSDERLKENMYDVTGSLNRILELKPTHFTWKENKKQDVGFIPQEVEEIIPEVVETSQGFINTDGEEEGIKDMKTISYPKLIPYLVDTIQELTKRIEKLEEDK